MQLGITAFLTGTGMDPGALGRAVEERGFSSLWLPHHSHLPLRAATPPGLVGGVSLEDYKGGLDPIVALAAAAAVTERIRLGTGVLLVAQQDPISLAKQLATLDHLSAGRLVLGIGFGWNRAEAEDHGVDFGRRRAIAREHVLCMKAIWGNDVAEFAGEFVTLPPAWSWPKPTQLPSPPILLGGGPSDAVFDAVCDYGDGWLPIGGSGLASALDLLRGRAEAAGRDPESLSVVPFGTVPDAGKLAYFSELGLAEVVLRVRNGTPDEMLRQLDAHQRFVPAVA
ncbi:MAG: LLM class F420-dependent oxidoreductase [Acidimicrobiales bacterium]